MTKGQRIWGLAAAVILLGACDNPERGSEPGANPTCAGGKCDDVEPVEDAEAICLDDDELIEAARDELLYVGVSHWGSDWEPGHIEELGDLDDDGVVDLLVFPGSGKEFDNEARVLFMSKGHACAELHAGNFIGFDLRVADLPNRSEGALDLVESSLENDGCELISLVFSYNGERYQIVDVYDESELCDGP